MPDQIPEQIKNQRSDVLLALTEKNSGEYRKKLLGRTVKVLLEEEAPLVEQHIWQDIPENM